MRRRNFLVNTALLASSVKMADAAAGNESGAVRSPQNRDYKRIATEEACSVYEIFQAQNEYLEKNPDAEPGLRALRKHYAGIGREVGPLLGDLGEGRIAYMDKHGIHKQIMVLGAPGVQIFDLPQAIELSRLANDRLADAVAKYPDRLEAMAVIPPQAPEAAAQELERGVNKLGLKGAIINSHTRGEYLDKRKYWPIFEAAQALDTPIYIHPRSPAPQILEPYAEYGIEGAMWGFAVETSLHALRLILAGVFDEFPRLQIIIGHMGEGIPFFLYRLDHRFEIERIRHTMPGVPKLKKLPGEYFRENFVITTSGMNWHPALVMAHTVLGPDKIMYAIDYPFEDTPPVIKAMDTAPLPEEDKRKIYHLNAERVFKLT